MTLLGNNKGFLDSICSFKLGLLTQFQKLQASYEFVCFLVLQTKSSRKTCGISFLSSVLQVQNLQRYFHVLPIAVLHYILFCRCRIFGGILMFFQWQFYIASCFVDVCLFTNTYPLVCDT